MMTEISEDMWMEKKDGILGMVHVVEEALIHPQPQPLFFFSSLLRFSLSDIDLTSFHEDLHGPNAVLRTLLDLHFLIFQFQFLSNYLILRPKKMVPLFHHRAGTGCHGPGNRPR